MTGEEHLSYSAFGASCSEVEVNLLTGERRVLRADIMMDAGNSLSPAIDAGQVCLAIYCCLGAAALRQTATRSLGTEAPCHNA